MKKIHFANLNSLRFIAAFVVVIHHTEQIKFAKGLPNSWGTAVVPLLGRLSVDLFFVLSGFLITSLLFLEKDSVEGISIKNFIIRRLLRIWPLYFIIMIIGFFIMPLFPALEIGKPFINVDNELGFNSLLYVLFLPHVQLIAIGPILYCAQSWSIGIEEQFYVIWPFLVKKLNPRGLFKFIVAYIIGYFFLCFLITYVSHHYIMNNYISEDNLKKVEIFFRDVLKFDCLLIGGLFALLNNKIKEDSIFLSKYFQLFIYFLELVLVYSGSDFHSLSWEIHAILYGFIIINLVRTKSSIININYSVFDYLGKISYGIYMYHILVINIVITIMYKYNLMLFAYPTIFILVILLSAISYKFIEGYFLQKKKYFSAISTG